MQLTATVPNATLERLPKYLAYLKIKSKQGVRTISATRVAEDLRLNPVLVRKDLASACQAGRPKTGYPIDVLIGDLEQFLGYNNAHEAFLIGAGRLGRALLGYEQFQEYGLSVPAAFDIAPALVGREFDGKPVFSMKKLPDLIARMEVRIAILTVPSAAAQSVCDLLVQCGIRAIWNFTSAHLEVPADIVLQNENLASSFAVLSRQLATRFAMEKEEEERTHEYNDR